MRKEWAYLAQQDRANERRPGSGNHIAAAVAEGALTKFQYSSGTSASFRQQQPVVPYHRESLDRKVVVFHMQRSSAAARRTEEGTAGLALSAYY
jgi:hypothetical protein